MFGKIFNCFVVYALSNTQDYDDEKDLKRQKRLQEEREREEKEYARRLHEEIMSIKLESIA